MIASFFSLQSCTAQSLRECFTRQISKPHFYCQSLPSKGIEFYFTLGAYRDCIFKKPSDDSEGSEEAVSWGAACKEVAFKLIPLNILPSVRNLSWLWWNQQILQHPFLQMLRRFHSTLRCCSGCQSLSFWWHSQLQHDPVGPDKSFSENLNRIMRANFSITLSQGRHLIFHNYDHNYEACRYQPAWYSYWIWLQPVKVQACWAPVTA